MELSELTAYARDAYRIEEQHKWENFPGFSVLCHPRTGKWVALLMRQWDTETGTEIERCDLKCGRQSLEGLSRPYLGAPFRMLGSKWVGVRFEKGTEPEVVCALFDRAVAAEDRQAFTVVLDSSPSSAGKAYRDTPLPFAGSRYQPPREVLPEKIRQMRRMFEYGRESMESRAANFLRQAEFMEDYEDDAPWVGDFVRYFPTYHDMTAKQLRGYFSWRTDIRRGEFRPMPSSAAYLYIYELLNGIGAASPEDSLEKLQAFERGYLDSGIGDPKMRQNLHRWMLELAIVNDLPQETARRYADPKVLETDHALAVLRSPEEHSDAEVFSALALFGGKKLPDSPVLARDRDRGLHLFGEVWRKAASACTPPEKDLFTQCFGEMAARQWQPFANAVYAWRNRQADRDYALDPCRIYRFRDGSWQVCTYEKPRFDRYRLQGLLHEADLRLRRYLKTGRYLRENPADAWAAPIIDAVIAADRQAAIEAARPKITIDLSGLEKIREDAAFTRDSLLTEDERLELIKESEAAVPDTAAAEAEPAAARAESPAREASVPVPALDAVQLQILRALLSGASAEDTAREHHVLPSVAADAINEALFDEIGDTVILCENDRLALVEDYREDIAEILGGTHDR